LFAPIAAAADEEVIVEGEALAAPDPSRTSASVTVLAADESLARGVGVADLVDTAAGAQVQRLGGLGDFSAVSIRGSTLRQVEVFLDGIPLNPDGADVVNLAELPLSGFSRVEVWRGNAAASFLASPIGGVVNLVSRDAGPAELSASYGSWDSARATAFASHELVPVARGHAGDPVDFQLFADAFHTRGDFVYFDDNATTYNVLDDHFKARDNNDKRQANAHARARAERGDLVFTLLDAPLFREEGLPGATTIPAEAARLQTTRNLAVLAIDAPGAGGSVYHLFREEILDDRAGEVGTGQQWRADRYHTLGLRGRLAFAPAEWVVPTLAAGGRLDQLRTHDLLGNAEEIDHRRASGKLAASADLRFWGDRLTLSPVLIASAIASDTDTVDLATDPRLGVLLRPLPVLALKANAGRYFRPPDLTELYGDQGALEGNDDLLPERGTQADLGGRLDLPPAHWGRLALDLCAFWLWSEDRIIWVQNSQFTLYPVNYGKTGVQGIEAAVDATLIDHLDLAASLTWQKSLNLTAGSSLVNNELPRTPPLDVNLRASLFAGQRARLGYTYTYTAPNYWDGANLYLSAPRHLHGAFLRLQPTVRWPSMELAALNLLDTLVEVVPRDPADEDDADLVVVATEDFMSYPLPGRTFIFTLAWAI